MTNSPYPWFVRGDLDGFFGLFVDNLVQILLIVSLCGLCGITAESPLLVAYILPGAGVSILIGNVFYALQARRLALKQGRSDVCAQPYGINTPSLLVYIFFVMIPANIAALDRGATPEEAARVAWQMGLLACLGSGAIEVVGSFAGAWIRKHTPRAALLSTLAGVAIGFIAMQFALQIFQRPIVAMPVLAIVLLAYAAGTRLPLGLPGGLVAVVTGTVVAWLGSLLPEFCGQYIQPRMDFDALTAAWATRRLCLPQFAGHQIVALLGDPAQWTGYLSVIIPMGLFNVIGSLQNVEAAEAAGDSYDTGSSMAVNGLGTIAAAAFGSCFPTTIYIGHPGWKALGARAGYSVLNGIAIAVVCWTGTVTAISQLVPLEAGIAIVLWIGVIITAQAFGKTPERHGPAVAIGLFPAIAAWGATVTVGSFEAAGGGTVQALLSTQLDAVVNGFFVHGMLLVERGFIFTCMILSAITALLIDRRFVTAGIWSCIGAALAWLGLTHAYQMKGNVVDYLLVGAQAAEGATAYPAGTLAVGYLTVAAVFFAYGWYRKGKSESVAGEVSQR